MPSQGDPQGLNRYSYTRNNPVLLVDPSGHCWGFASGLRDTSFYSTTCSNLDMALSIVQHPDATVGQKIVAGGYVVAEAAAHAAVAVGSAVIGGQAAAAAAGSSYAYAGAAAIETAAAAYPATAAAVGGVAETAVECSMTGGGCGVADYAVGAITAGVAHRLSNPCHSFSADTVVLTDEGLLPIVELEVGDWVYGYDETTGEMAYYPITATWAHIDPTIVYLTIDGEVIETTPSHLFYTDEGWVQAGELQIGEAILKADETYGFIQTSFTSQQPQWMYDITVGVVHTFFVGDEHWLVHNCNGSAYSVYYETQISEDIWDASRGVHNQAANANLFADMNADPQFAQGMAELGINQDSLMGQRVASRESPSGFTWHHAQEPGTMQLVNRASHSRNSAYFHPNKSGGYKAWGPQ